MSSLFGTWGEPGSIPICTWSAVSLPNLRARAGPGASGLCWPACGQCLVVTAASGDVGNTGALSKCLTPGVSLPWLC